MLKGKEVTLRLFTKDNLGELFARDSNTGARSEHFPIALHTLSGMRKQFQETGCWEEEQGRMVIANRDGEMAGVIMFFRPSPMLAGYQVGYVVFWSEDWNNRCMTEALRIFSAYLFELKLILRLHIATHADNIAPQRVAEKCGYRLESTSRQFVFIRGKYADYTQYSLLGAECPSLAQALKA